MEPALLILFCIGVTTLLYTFAGYPLIVHLLGIRRLRLSSPPPELSPDSGLCSVSVVLVARNEGPRLRTRIENLLDTDHPLDRLEIVLVSDGSTDHPESLIGELPVRLLTFDVHQGKAVCINAGVQASNGEIIVFADARQRFNRDTIPKLIEPFRSPQVGAVSGELLIAPSEGGVGVGNDTYWRMEKAIRLGESRLDSSIGCTGAVYAIRRVAFRPLPRDTILDDVITPMQIALSGFRVVFDPQAKAYDPQKLDPANEARRKRRTLAGNYQMLFRYPGWLLPWKNRLWIQLVSHKYLRLAAPWLLFSLLFISGALAWGGSAIFTVFTFVQILFYLLACLGLKIRKVRSRLLAIPAAFTFLNWMTLMGLADFLLKGRKPGW